PPRPRAPRWAAAWARRAMPGGAHDGIAGPAARFCGAAGAAGLAEPSDPVVAVAADPAATAPHRLPADPAPVRPHPQGGDAAAHAVVAHAAAPGAGRAGDHRGRRTA